MSTVFHVKNPEIHSILTFKLSSIRRISVAYIHAKVTLIVVVKTIINRRNYLIC